MRPGDPGPATGYTNCQRPDTAGLYYVYIEIYIVETLCVHAYYYTEGAHAGLGRGFAHHAVHVCISTVFM